MKPKIKDSINVKPLPACLCGAEFLGHIFAVTRVLSDGREMLSLQTSFASHAKQDAIAIGDSARIFKYEARKWKEMKPGSLI